MTVTDKLAEIEEHYSYWVGNYKKNELNTNNVRIVGEAICKALILNNRGEHPGTVIILGLNSALPTKRTNNSGALNFADLIQVLRDLGIVNSSDSKRIGLCLELIRDRSNPSSHSSNKTSDDTTIEDINLCHNIISFTLKWFYIKIGVGAPDAVRKGFEGTIDYYSLPLPDERWHELEIACRHFDKRKFQYIFVSPTEIAKEAGVVESFTKIPWRLILDFDNKSDENSNGLLFNFNKQFGEGYKKVFTINDRIEFDRDFPHYWFLANGQGSLSRPADYKAWRSEYKKLLSQLLFQPFLKGSRVKSRIVVMLEIPPFYAEDIIEEFNRLDEQNLRFILCSETETYDTIFEKMSNVELIKISAAEISNGIRRSHFGLTEAASAPISIPYLKDGKRIAVLLHRTIMII